MRDWLFPELRQEVRKVFEPRYKRKLTDEEVEEIADNLSVFVEETLKYIWGQKCEKKLKAKVPQPHSLKSSNP